MCFDLRPKIPSNLNSGAWKTGPNLPHGLTSQRDDRDSPFSSLLSKSHIEAQKIANLKVVQKPVDPDMLIALIQEMAQRTSDPGLLKS
jgi:hypothetical protein